MSISLHSGGNFPWQTIDPAARRLYITHEGVRNFHADFGSTDLELERGDIITYSDEL